MVLSEIGMMIISICPTIRELLHSWTDGVLWTEVDDANLILSNAQVGLFERRAYRHLTESAQSVN
jgi:hypothetical protein